MEWCLFMMTLEPFFKDKAHCKSHRGISPHLSPQRGYPIISDRPLFASVLSCLPAFQHPRLRSVLWLARRWMCLSRARQKPPSSLTLKTGSPTDGLYGSRTSCPLTSRTRVVEPAHAASTCDVSSHWFGTNSGLRPVRVSTRCRLMAAFDG